MVGPYAFRPLDLSREGAHRTINPELAYGRRNREADSGGYEPDDFAVTEVVTDSLRCRKGASSCGTDRGVRDDRGEAVIVRAGPGLFASSMAASRS